MTRAGRRRVHVVVTCAHRKSRPVPRALHLRNVTGVRVTTRARTWIERLTDPSVAPLCARQLYAGEHWTLARRLVDLSPHAVVRLWVCSAGYGLIPVDAEIRPYSATFTAGHADTVPGGRAGMTAWWEVLAEWAGPSGSPRSFTQLVASDPDAHVLLVLSAPYLAACRDDLLEAAEVLGGCGAMSVISGGTRTGSDLDEFLLPVDGRLQAALGGTLQSLNVRVAAHVLAAGLTTHDEMSDHLSTLLAVQPRLPRFERRRLTDAEVRRFVRSELRRDPDVRHTTLLRSLRDSGRACEQSRFAQLFLAEKATPT